MRNIVILKLGSALEALRARRGDYEHYIATGMGLDLEDCRIVNPVQNDEFPHPRACAGVVITGSDAMITDAPEWSLRSQAWLGDALGCDIPVLGICYGHQLLAQTLGGTVGWTPGGEEIGTITVDLSADAALDPLFSNFSAPLIVQACHSQSMLKLPPGARHLASNAQDVHQGFAWGRNAWGVQFHPEFDADISRTYIEDDREALIEAGRDPDHLLRSARDTDDGARLLRRFADFVSGNR